MRHRNLFLSFGLCAVALEVALHSFLLLLPAAEGFYSMTEELTAGFSPLEKPIAFTLTSEHDHEAAKGADGPRSLRKPIPGSTYQSNAVACTYDRELLITNCPRFGRLRFSL
jgi:hypothetical protein